MRIEFKDKKIVYATDVLFHIGGINDFFVFKFNAHGITAILGVKIIFHYVDRYGTVQRQFFHNMSHFGRGSVIGKIDDIILR